MYNAREDYVTLHKGKGKKQQQAEHKAKVINLIYAQFNASS